MATEISSKYEENKSLLERKIREGTVKVMMENHQEIVAISAVSP